MITVTRSIQFDSAHRLINHESKCKYVHGHRYVLEATFSAPELDSIGRVVDFGVIKEKLGGWIDANWDHTIILNEADKPLGSFIDSHTGQKSYYLPYNPTAENMARYIAEKIVPELFSGQPLKLQKIALFETPNCSVEWSGK